MFQLKLKHNRKAICTCTYRVLTDVSVLRYNPLFKAACDNAYGRNKMHKDRVTEDAGVGR